MTKDELIDRIYRFKITRPTALSIEGHILALITMYINDEKVEEAIFNVIRDFHE